MVSIQSPNILGDDFHDSFLGVKSKIVSYLPLAIFCKLLISLIFLEDLLPSFFSVPTFGLTLDYCSTLECCSILLLQVSIFLRIEELFFSIFFFWLYFCFRSCFSKLFCSSSNSFQKGIKSLHRGVSREWDLIF